jgi:rubrerythrin
LVFVVKFGGKKMSKVKRNFSSFIPFSKIQENFKANKQKSNLPKQISCKECGSLIYDSSLINDCPKCGALISD